jgi:hypothetical protein
MGGKEMKRGRKAIFDTKEFLDLVVPIGMTLADEKRWKKIQCSGMYSRKWRSAV